MTTAVDDDLEQFARRREAHWARLLEAWSSIRPASASASASASAAAVSEREQIHRAFGMLSAVRMAREEPLERVEERVRREVDEKLDALACRITQVARLGTGVLGGAGGAGGAGGGF